MVHSWGSAWSCGNIRGPAAEWWPLVSAAVEASAEGCAGAEERALKAGRGAWPRMSAQRGCQCMGKGVRIPQRAGA